LDEVGKKGCADAVIGACQFVKRGGEYAQALEYTKATEYELQTKKPSKTEFA
jgi:hypothetical protein